MGLGTGKNTVGRLDGTNLYFRTPIVLLKGSESIQTLELGLGDGDHAVCASCCDPYIGVVSAQGHLVIATMDTANNKLSLVQSGVPSTGYTAISLYKDMPGLLTSAVTHNLVTLIQHHR